MTNDVQEDDEAAIARRRDEALRRALNTPPPLKPIGKPKGVKPTLDKRQSRRVHDK